MSEKTLFLFNEFDEGVHFFELDGDYSRLNDVYINSVDSAEELQDELTDIVYNGKTGEHKVKFMNEPTKDWTHFVSCGFIP